MVRHGDPEKFWKRIGEYFLQWELTGSPVRWKP